MINTQLVRLGLPTILLALLSLPASAQTFRVQCPTTTITHPSSLHNNNSEPAYSVPTTLALNSSGFLAPTANVNGAIKCQQISGGDGYATMGDGTQTYMFSFGPLSGIVDIANGKPGTQFPNLFNTPFTGVLAPGDPDTTITNGGTFTYNGAIGQVPDLDNNSVINSHVDP